MSVRYKSEGPLFAIYKRGNHLGNQRGKNEKQAIDNYVIAAQFSGFLDDTEFMAIYSAVPAIEDIHYTLSAYLKAQRST